MDIFYFQDFYLFLCGGFWLVVSCLLGISCVLIYIFKARALQELSNLGSLIRIDSQHSLDKFYLVSCEILGKL